MNKTEFVLLFNREIRKLQNEVEAYPNDDQMWAVVPGTINSGGNLVQHLIGNLRTYIGLTLGNVPYVRNRDAEFGDRLFTREGFLLELNCLAEITEMSLNRLSDEDLKKEYSKDVLAMFPDQTVGIVLTHLLIHLGYHMGQINYHRRFTASLSEHS